MAVFGLERPVSPSGETEVGIGQLTRISHRFLLNGCNWLDNKELWDSAEYRAYFGGCSAETSKRQAREAVLSLRPALIVGPSYSSMGPSGVLRTTRRGPIVSMYFQRQPSTTNLSLSRQNDQRQNFEWTTCLDEPKRTLSLYPKKRIRCKSFAGHPAPLKNKLQSN